MAVQRRTHSIADNLSNQIKRRCDHFVGYTVVLGDSADFADRFNCLFSSMVLRGNLESGDADELQEGRGPRKSNTCGKKKGGGGFTSSMLCRGIELVHITGRITRMRFVQTNMLENGIRALTSIIILMWAQGSEHRRSQEYLKDIEHVHRNIMCVQVRCLNPGNALALRHAQGHRRFLG